MKLKPALLALTLTCAAVFVADGVMTSAHAAHGGGEKTKETKDKGGGKEKEKKKPPPKAEAGEAGVGYGGAKVQLAPLMSPYRDASGRVQYQVIIVRLVLDVGVNERPACFMAPIVQEKFLLHLAAKQPTPDDLLGQRKDVFTKELLDVATAATDRGYYAGIELVDDTAPPLDPKSQTLSTQCK